MINARREVFSMNDPYSYNGFSVTLNPTLEEPIGYFFGQFLFYLVGWDRDFQKLVGWVLVGFFKFEKVLGFALVGFLDFRKVLGYVYSVLAFYSKSTRLRFSRFSVFFQKLVGWGLVGFCTFLKNYSVEHNVFRV